MYEGIELIEIYQMKPHHLEEYYKKWEEKLNKALIEAEKKNDSQETIDRIHINNPKIPLKYVRENGILLYENKKYGDLKLADKIQ